MKIKNKKIKENDDSYNNNQQPYHEYDLCGVVNHIGNTVARGHYIAYCKGIQTHKWFRFDDEAVEELNINEIVDPNAYILFYTRKE